MDPTWRLTHLGGPPELGRLREIITSAWRQAWVQVWPLGSVSKCAWAPTLSLVLRRQAGGTLVGGLEPSFSLSYTKNPCHLQGSQSQVTVLFPYSKC